MERDVYQKLLAWKDSPSRKPLLLQGARQVGKTFLLKAFAEKAYDDYVYLNFETDFNLRAFFEVNLKPESILEKLTIYFGQDIIPGKTLLIFDEIQECTQALTSLKYFHEVANEHHVVCAGSLLGVTLSGTKGFPVGQVDFMDLFPLSFFEFLDAVGQNQLRDYLNKINLSEKIPAPFHIRLMNLLRRYLFVGGMPEAVAAYVNDPLNFTGIRAIQSNIINAYVMDFSKHAEKSQVIRIMDIWNSIPEQLAKENKKFIFSVIRKSARGREYEEAIQWLASAGLILKSYKIKTPKLPIRAYIDRTFFKVFLLDVGLLGAMSHLNPKIIVEGDRLFQEFKGALTENFVAQELTISANKQLYYWADATHEVDFIVEKEMNLYPLEVKSGASTQKASLRQYGEKYSPERLSRSSSMGLKVENHLDNYPLYLVSRFPIVTEEIKS